MMLDRLPAWARYFLVMVLLGPVVTGVLAVAAVVAAHGIADGIDYGDAFESGADLAVKGVAAGLIGYITMWVLPITRQFGVGKDALGYDKSLLPDRHEAEFGTLDPTK